MFRAQESGELKNWSSEGNIVGFECIRMPKLVAVAVQRIGVIDLTMAERTQLCYKPTIIQHGFGRRSPCAQKFPDTVTMDSGARFECPKIFDHYYNGFGITIAIKRHTKVGFGRPYESSRCTKISF